MNIQTHKFNSNSLLLTFTTILFGFLATVSASATNRSPVADFDGDGKSDIAVFRPSDGYWYISKSSGGYSFIKWGKAGDTPIPGDYDNDGKTDIAVHRKGVLDFRSDDIWYILKSSDNNYTAKAFGRSEGLTTYTPTPPGDYDGDGRTDLVLVKAYITNLIPTPPNTLEVLQSSTDSVVRKELQNQYERFVSPVDYDGDGKADIAVFGNSIWSIVQSSNGAIRSEYFGFSSDKLIPADYDGDGKADIAVWRASSGYWYWLSSRDNSFNSIRFGLSDDKPTPADYDGDGKTDIAVYRPSTGVWYLQQSKDGFRAEQFGLSDDTPIPNVFVR